MRWRWFLMLLLFLLIISGCWNRRDPENLAIVLATAFDWDEEVKMYQLIVQLSNPLAVQEVENKGASKGESPPSWVVSAYGRTPFEATRNLSEDSSREFF